MISSRCLYRSLPRVIRQVLSKRIFPIPTGMRKLLTFDSRLSRLPNFLPLYSRPVVVIREIYIPFKFQFLVDLWREERGRRGSRDRSRMDEMFLVYYEYPRYREEQSRARISSRIDPAGKDSTKIRKIQKIPSIPQRLPACRTSHLRGWYRCFYRSVGKFFSVLRGIRVYR